MIYAVIGQTGSGKSGFVLRKAAEALRKYENRKIVTNLALDIPELCQFLTEEYGETFDAAERIQLLDLDQVGEFWRFYGNGYTIPPERTVKIKMGDGEERECQDFLNNRCPEKASHSVTYILDEADEIFDAKRWAKIVHDLKYYTRHQRKFGDDVFMLAPAWDFLVKEMRLQFHGVWVMENTAQMKLGKIPFIGSLFKAIPRIKANLYKVRHGGAWGGHGELPRETVTYSIEPKGIDRCYRTEDGLGVRGFADTVRKAEKAKGLHPAWIAVGVAACIVAIPLILKALSFGVSSAVRTVSAAPTFQTNQVAAVNSHTAPSRVPVIQSTSVNRMTESPAYVSDSSTAGVHCTGVISGRAPGELVFILSDGRVLSSLQPDYQGALRDAFGRIVGGIFGYEKYKFKAPGSPVEAVGRHGPGDYNPWNGRPRSGV